MIVQTGKLPHDDYDVVVIGAGVAGMSAALFAANLGRRVLVVEHSGQVGGTGAISAGTLWLPNTRFAVPGEDSIDNARRFLDGAVGNHASAELREAFLLSAAAAVNELNDRSQVKLRAYALHPDYMQEVEGATLRGRALEPVPFDGRELGEMLKFVRLPIPEFTVLGGMMVDRNDIRHLLGATKSWTSMRHAAGLLGRYAVDRLRGPRGSRLVMGNALVGRLLLSLLEKNVDIALQTRLAQIDRLGNRSFAVGLGDRRSVTTSAVVFAGGGFSRHPQRRAQLLGDRAEALSLIAVSADGSAQDLAIQAGARVVEATPDAAFWAPVSVRCRPDGSQAIFPHFVMDRGKPGIIAVNRSGRRFVNEATSYHRFARAMFESDRSTPTIPTFLLTDAIGLKRYGLGMVRPGTRNLRNYLADGYLKQSGSLAGLANALGIEPVELDKTVIANNAYAETGVDLEFARGSTAYHRANGDSTHAPNPNIGRIAEPPFFAIRLFPGDIGASSGLATNANAQLLDRDDQPIDGMYACGNDMQSIMGGTYPGPGITLGPAAVFAYRAMQHCFGNERIGR